MEAAYEIEHDDLFLSGHRGCPGCGLALAVRHILKATGPEVIVVSPTGCLETISSPYGHSSWGVPWIHHLFENGPSVASGVAASLKAKGQEDIRVVAIGGDGGTFDIGFGAFSGMLERATTSSTSAPTTPPTATPAVSGRGPPPTGPRPPPTRPEPAPLASRSPKRTSRPSSPPTACPTWPPPPSAS